MLANLPVELILLICEYPEFKDLGQLSWTSNRMMRIIKKYLPILLKGKILFYLPCKNDNIDKGRICLFDSHTNSIEQIARFTNYLRSYEVATTKDKIFALSRKEESFEIFDLNTRQITRGPDPPEWRWITSIAYYKDKLYYLGGETNRVDVLIDEKWETGPAFPLPITRVQAITCDEALYVIDGWGRGGNKIYRLSDDEREWIEIGKIPEGQSLFGIASLNRRIYITGGCCDGVLKSCLCFDPSAPVDSQISRIADMNYARINHSLIVANGKLYAVGGYQEFVHENVCNSIEEYDPQTNKWQEVGEFNI